MLAQIAIALFVYALIVAPLVVHAVWCACLKTGCSPIRREWWTS